MPASGSSVGLSPTRLHLKPRCWLAMGGILYSSLSVRANRPGRIMGKQGSSLRRCVHTASDSMTITCPKFLHAWISFSSIFWADRQNCTQGRIHYLLSSYLSQPLTKGLFVIATHPRAVYLTQVPYLTQLPPQPCLLSSVAQVKILQNIPDPAPNPTSELLWGVQIPICLKN